MHNVISYHPLTDQFKEGIERAGGPARFTTVARLRSLGPRALLAEARRLKAELITIAIERDSSRPVAGPLALLAVLSGSRRIRIHWPDGGVEEIPRWRAAMQLKHIVVDQVTGRLALRTAARQLQRFESAGVREGGTASGRGNAVLYLDANLSFGVAAGGSVGHTKGVIDGLIGAGFEVDYASVKTMPTHTPGAVWHQIPAPSLYGFPPELNYYTFNHRYERFVEKMAARRSYAFLYQRMSLHNFSGARLRKHVGLPLVLEYNGSEAWASANWAEKLALHDIALAAERAALRNADLVVTVSKPLRDAVAAAGVPEERIVTHPNCIDPAIFDPGRFSDADRATLRARWGIGPDALVATFIGTFGTWHGVDFLARGVRRLIDEDRAFLDRHRLHFLFVGDGLKMPEVRAAIGQAPYSDFATLTGLVPQAEAPAYLAASDIFLSPHMPNPDGTPFFGSPTKLFEYMAMERPIIASDLDQIGEVLRGGAADRTDACRLAELYGPADMNSLLTALRRVVENLRDARAMAGRARQAALSAYTWDHHVGAIVSRMRELRILPLFTSGR